MDKKQENFYSITEWEEEEQKHLQDKKKWEKRELKHFQDKNLALLIGYFSGNFAIIICWWLHVSFDLIFWGVWTWIGGFVALVSVWVPFHEKERYPD